MSFLPTQDQDKENDCGRIHILRFKKSEDLRLNLMVIKEDVGIDNKGIPMNSIEEAEEYVLEQDFNFRDIYDPKKHSKTDLGCLIIRAGSHIAIRTRRGAGNRVIYNPSNEKLLQKAMSITENMNLKFISDERCSDDKVIVLYIGPGAIDSGYIFTELKTQNYLYEMQEDEEFHLSAKDYGEIVWLK